MGKIEPFPEHCLKCKSKNYTEERVGDKPERTCHDCGHVWKGW